MSSQTDVAKARIRFRRKERAAKKALLEFADQRSKYLAVVDAKVKAEIELRNALEANGQCGVCEKPKRKCEGHVYLAASEHAKEYESR